MEHIQIALDKAKQRYSEAVRPVMVEPVRREALENFPRAAVVNPLRWSTLRPAEIDLAHLAQNRVITADKRDPAYAAFDRLRTKIQHEMHQRKWRSVAITSPTVGCGKSVVTLNLAFSLAHQEECRSLVVDLDLGRTTMADLLGLERPAPMDEFITGRAAAENVFVRHGSNLAFGANGRRAAFTAELLHASTTTRVLAEACNGLQPDIVIYDMPPMLCGDDTMAFLPNVDCVILVAAAEASSFAEVDLCERELSEKSNLLGVVLNKCHYTQQKYGY